MEPFGASGRRESRALGYLSLFTSFATLLCCALPSLLALVGLGAAVASLVSAAPWLAALSRRKAWVFAVSGAVLLVNFAYLYAAAPRAREAAGTCPPDDAAACVAADRGSRILLWMSAVVYLGGFAAAYLIGPFLARTG
jgi:hypothetical protein